MLLIVIFKFHLSQGIALSVFRAIIQRELDMYTVGLWPMSPHYDTDEIFFLPKASYVAMCYICLLDVHDHFDAFAAYKGMVNKRIYGELCYY